MLLVGCNDKFDNIFLLKANPMENDDAEALAPTSDECVSWMAGEQININGTGCIIEEKPPGSFTIECPSTQKAPVYAIYPNTVNTYGNQVEVSYSPGASTLTLKMLAVDYTDNTLATHKVFFPMAAYQSKLSSQLMFDHLTAGMQFTIENTTDEACALAAVRIYLYGDEVPTPTEKNGVIVSWENQGPIVPGGTIGSTTGDVDAEYASEMRFAMMTDGEPNVIIQGHSSITFSVPVTVRSLTSFAVTGYKPDWSELFSFQKAISRSLELNKMYNMPTITLFAGEL